MTYAIFKAAGFQYRAEPGDVLRLPRMDVDVGGHVTFDEVLFGAADGDVLVGQPVVKDARVTAEVLSHDRADKIIVWKFKRRKTYRRKQGHRQDYTEIRVSEIDLGDGRVAKLDEATDSKPKKSKPAAKKSTKSKSTKSKKAEPAAEKDTAEPAAKKGGKSKASGKKKSPSKKKSKKED